MEHKSPALPRFGWLPGVATILAIAACYGTLLVVAALSLLGTTLVVHEGAWAGAISLFALLAVVGMALGYRRHHMLAPLVIAVISLALILWVMFGSYNRIIELIGFTGLIIAATWDWRLKRREATSTPVSEQL
jgi:arsenite methyltransferase